MCKSITNIHNMFTAACRTLLDRIKIIYNSVANPDIRHKVWTPKNIAFIFFGFFVFFLFDKYFLPWFFNNIPAKWQLPIICSAWLLVHFWEKKYNEKKVRS